MGADHEQFASLLGNVARMTMAHGRLEDASPYLKRALAIFDQRPWYVSTDVYAPVAPPAPYVEVQPAVPYPGAVWINGYWNWSGNRHTWVPGRYDRPRPGWRWQPRRWERAPRGGWHSQGGGWVR